MLKDKTLWLIGANSDIALSFINKHGSSFSHLVLASRNTEALTEAAQKSKLKNISVHYIDLTDKSSIDDFMEKNPTPFGVIFFSGHIDYNGKYENNSDSNISETVMANYLGPVFMIEKLSSEMQKRESGFIALLSSAGEVRGKYSNRFYVSSKKAVTTYLEGIMQRNEKHSVKTVIIKLGHTDTKMLKKLGDSRKPVFVAKADAAADFLFDCIKKQKSAVKYYRPVWKWIALAYRLLPLSFYNHSDI